MALADGKVRLAPRRPPTVRQQLLDYYRCLQRWRVRYAPQSPTEELHPCFLEAIKNLDIVEYYLDCSVLPDPQTENELLLSEPPPQRQYRFGIGFQHRPSG